METFRLILAFLLFAISALGENEIVLDFWGNPVKPNTLYYPKYKFFGGPFISRYRVPEVVHEWDFCPQSVVYGSASVPFLVRVPFMFELSEPDVVVRVSTELNIKFPSFFPTTCNDTGFWQVKEYNPDDRCINLSYPPWTGVSSTFIIKKSDDNRYNFAFVSTSKVVTDVVLLREDSRLDLKRLGLRKPLSYGDEDLKVKIFRYP